MPSRDLLVQNKELVHKVEDLERWKREACELFDKIDLQAVAKELGLLPGQDIAPHVLRGIQRLKNEVRHLEGQLEYVRKWQGLGIGPKDPVHFFVIPHRGIAIPMSAEHLDALCAYVDWLQDPEPKFDASLRPVIAKGPNENNMLAEFVHNFRGSFWDKGK